MQRHSKAPFWLSALLIMAVVVGLTLAVGAVADLAARHLSLPILLGLVLVGLFGYLMGSRA